MVVYKKLKVIGYHGNRGLRDYTFFTRVSWLLPWVLPFVYEHGGGLLQLAACCSFCLQLGAAMTWLPEYRIIGDSAQQSKHDTANPDWDCTTVVFWLLENLRSVKFSFIHLNYFHKCHIYVTTYITPCFSRSDSQLVLQSHVYGLYLS